MEANSENGLRSAPFRPSSYCLDQNDAIRQRHRGDLTMASRPKTDKKLIAETRPFQKESRLRSIWEIASTFVVYGACIAAIVMVPWWSAKIAITLFVGAVQFRFFSLYHDHVHGSLLSRSPATRRLMSVIGVLILAPRSVWHETHKFHHSTNGHIKWTSIGSFPIMTTTEYAEASPMEKLKYRAVRHPLSILCGYITIGIKGMCFDAFRRAPKRHWVGPLALAIHFSVFAVLVQTVGLSLALLVWIAPAFVNHALASYLFYAQHNFPETRFFEQGAWDYSSAAVHGSSYLKMGWLMQWLTAHIGYHHIHHLNPRIPSYRLAEAMDAIEGLQSPNVTSFHPRDMLACLRLNTWNPETGRMQP